MKRILIILAFLLTANQANLFAQCSTGTVSSATVTSSKGDGTAANPAECPVGIAFCYTLTSYVQNGTNWVHGIYLPFGSLPAGATVTATTANQPAQDGTGTWIFVNAAAATTAGLPGPGYYMDADNDGQVTDGFGDNATTFPSLAPFCFNIALVCSDDNAFTPTVGVSADGMTGSWTDFSCPLSADDNNTGPSVVFYEPTCTPPSASTAPTNQSICREGSVTGLSVSATPSACASVPASNPSLTTSTSKPLTLTTNPFGAPAFAMTLTAADMPAKPYPDCTIVSATVSYAAYGIVPPSADCAPNDDDLFLLDIYNGSNAVIFFDLTGAASPTNVISNVNILAEIPSWTPASGLNLYIQQDNNLDPSSPCDWFGLDPFSWDVSSLIATVTIQYSCPAQPAPTPVQKWWSAATGGTQIGTGNSLALSSIPVANFDPATAGTYTVYSETVCGTCEAATRTASTITVTAPPNAGTLSGTQNVCGTGTTTFTSNGDTGGTWSSSNTAVATVDASTGVVTGVAAGTATITYSVAATSPCTTPATATRTVTVVAPPNAGTLSGTQNVCGTGTTTFASNGDTGGTWSSSNTAVATVNASGDVTGVAAGTATITYSVAATSPCTTAATATRTVTVVAPPTANAGADVPTACSIAVALAATGTGTWSGGAGTFSDTSSPTSTYTPAAAEGGTTVNLTWTVAATAPCTVAATDQVAVAVGSCIVPTATVSADLTDPCFCVTVPILNTSNNVVTTPGVLGDVMVITTTPANTSVVWNVVAGANTTITSGATAVHVGGGVYHVDVTYNDGAGGWAVTATPAAPNAGLGVQNGAGGTTCTYTIGTFANLTATACTALTITGATPAGGTYNPTSIAAPAPGSAATTVALQYTYNSSLNAAFAPACPLTLNATATIPACPVGCAASTNMQWGN